MINPPDTYREAREIGELRQRQAEEIYNLYQKNPSFRAKVEEHLRSVGILVARLYDESSAVNETASEPNEKPNDLGIEGAVSPETKIVKKRLTDRGLCE